MGFSVWQIAIVAIVVLVLFGRGRISEMMGDFGKGISSFKKGMNEDVDASSAKPAEPNGQIEGPTAESAPATDTKSADQKDAAN
ncbi:MAG: twin-arginine translocase TatA/TatE family subunit [Pseudomonadota bacterium]